MSKSISLASAVEKNRLSSDVPYLMLVDVDIVEPFTGVVSETMRIVRNTESVVYNSFTYEAGHFDVELKSQAGTQQTVSLTVRDVTQALQGRMQAYGGGVGFTVRLMVIAANALDRPAEIQEDFEIIGASAANYVCTFTLGAANALTKTFPRRRQTKDFCQWRFKDPRTCRYTGPATSCDLTLQGPNGCAQKSNTIHFGAFSGINANGIRYG